MRFVPILILAFLSTFFCASLYMEEETMPEPDTLTTIAENSFAQHHAHSVSAYLSLPPSTITRVSPPDEDLNLRTIVHTNTDSSRYLPLCYHAEHCLMVSPYELKSYDRRGALSKTEKVLMMLFARKGEEVEPAGLLHFGKEGEEMGVWDWVKSAAKESRESLVRKYGEERFQFPDLEPVELK